MKANEFFKKYGIEHAKDVSSGWITNYENVNLEDLKRLVESHELVDSYGGLDKAKLRCYPAKHLTMQSYHTLRGAVADVESCR